MHVCLHSSCLGNLFDFGYGDGVDDGDYYGDDCDDYYDDDEEVYGDFDGDSLSLVAFDNNSDYSQSRITDEDTTTINIDKIAIMNLPCPMSHTTMGTAAITMAFDTISSLAAVFYYSFSISSSFRAH